ncbi:hypothetical protein LCGC14_0820620 [marine sediment metagenome]|uniref:Uncharacterized protein n=1 Tax=marine sediment metagenome TaxID=412755 RepID=A0A0F9SRM6_9ZZZZ
MKTKEELQAWMREGCPVADIGLHKGCGRANFELQVSATDKRLFARCMVCRAFASAPGVQVAQVMTPGVDAAWVTGLSDALLAVCGWIETHAGMARDQAKGELWSRADSRALIERWALRAMLEDRQERTWLGVGRYTLLGSGWATAGYGTELEINLIASVQP